MNYELAQELKDKGFPQATCGFYYWDREERCNRGTDIGIFYRDGIVTHTIKVPTLSELIEACGDEFGKLLRVETPYKPLWITYSTKEPKDSLTIDTWPCEGKTPEEAVARLWLTLQKHE